MTAELRPAPLLACEQPRFAGSSAELGEFTADAERLLLIGDWAPLFQLCAGKLRLVSGRSYIRGHAAERAVADGQVGLALRDAPLPPSWTLLEVLRQSGLLLGLSLREASERARDRARQAGLEDQLGKPLGRLGAGERRAAVLLIAALGDARVLALEEPLAGLEPSAQSFVIGVLERVLLGRCALISARELPSAQARALLRAGDEILVLGSQGLSARGAYAELSASAASYRVLVLRHADALSALLAEAGYHVLEGRAAGGLGLSVADPAALGTGPLLAASLRADAPIVELGPLWPREMAPARASAGG